MSGKVTFLKGERVEVHTETRSYYASVIEILPEKLLVREENKKAPPKLVPTSECCRAKPKKAMKAKLKNE